MRSLTRSTRGGKGACWSSRFRIRKSDKLYLLTPTCIKPTNKLVSSLFGAPLVLGQPRATLDSQDSPRPELGGSHHLPPYSILHGTYIQMVFLSRDSQGGVITLCSDLRLGWGLNQTCSSCRKLSNGVSHFTCTHQGRVDSRLLVVGSQTASLIHDLYFCHNLCFRCSNGSCKPIFDIYISLDFQWYNKKPRCEGFWPLQSNSEISRVSMDSQVPISRVWVSSSHSSQSGVATHMNN